MNLEQLFASSGLGGLIADEFLVTQIGVLMLTGILFVASLALCIMAVRAASTARRASNEVEDIVGEMRQLTAQVERASYTQSRANPQKDTGEIDDDTSLDGDDEDADPPAKSKRTKNAPSALLRGFLNRR